MMPIHADLLKKLPAKIRLRAKALDQEESGEGGKRGVPVSAIRDRAGRLLQKRIRITSKESKRKN